MNSPQERVLAALVILSAAALVYALSGGPWARATFSGAEDAADGEVTVATAEVELQLSGEVDVDPGDGPVAEALDPSAPAGAVLEGSAASATRDLTQTLALLIAVVAAVGLIVDLPQRLWSLLASAGMVCVLAAAVLRDNTTSVLSEGAAALDAGAFQVHPTGWSSLAIGAAAAAALAAFLATAERGAASSDPLVDDEEVVGGDGAGNGDGDGAQLAKRQGRRGPGRNRPLNWLPSRGR
jgi:hypothetical protein